MKCSACSGSYHLATGHILGDDTVLCGPCTRGFIKWIKLRESSMGSRRKDKKTGIRERESFTDAALKSIKVGE